MNIQKFKSIIKEREYVEKISYGEWQEGIDKCREEEITVLAQDIPSTMKYLKHDCTPEEYSWISEIIDDLAEETGSTALIECYKDLMKKFPEECRKYNIAGSIESAEEILKGMDNGKKD